MRLANEAVDRATLRGTEAVIRKSRWLMDEKYDAARCGWDARVQCGLKATGHFEVWPLP